MISSSSSSSSGSNVSFSIGRKDFVIVSSICDGTLSGQKMFKDLLVSISSFEMIFHINSRGKTYNGCTPSIFDTFQAKASIFPMLFTTFVSLSIHVYQKFDHDIKLKIESQTMFNISNQTQVNPFTRFEGLFVKKSVVRKFTRVYIVHETSESMNTRIAALEKLEKMRMELDHIKKLHTEIEITGRRKQNANASMCKNKKEVRFLGFNCHKLICRLYY